MASRTSFFVATVLACTAGSQVAAQAAGSHGAEAAAQEDAGTDDADASTSVTPPPAAGSGGRGSLTVADLHLPDQGCQVAANGRTTDISSALLLGMALWARRRGRTRCQGVGTRERARMLGSAS
jgi:hypothetical protein